MYKRINRVTSNFLLKIFELTDAQLEASDYQIPMTQEIYNSILDRCTELGVMADDLFFSLLNEYPEYLSVYDQRIMSIPGDLTPRFRKNPPHRNIHLENLKLVNLRKFNKIPI